MDKKSKTPFEKMNDTLSGLEGRVLDCLKSSNVDEIFKQFSQFDAPTIITGSGGSLAACNFLASVLNEKNACICEAKLPDEVWHVNLRPYKNLFAVSSSGENAGVDKAFGYAQKFGVNCKMLTGNQNVDLSKNVVYNTSIEKEDSFISFANTLMPMALGLCYYLGDKDKTCEIVSDMFRNAGTNKVPVKDGTTYEIVGKDNYPAASAFVESCLSESSIAVPVVSAKYDECHGRTTSVLQQSDRQLLIFKDKENDVDKFLYERLSKSGVSEDRLTAVEAGYDDLILNDFYLTICMANWCRDLAESKGVDLSTMQDQNGDRLHLQLDERALKVWEEESGQEFFGDGKPDFKGLTSVGEGEIRPQGFYAPTGKFLDGDLGATGRNFGDEATPEN